MSDPAGSFWDYSLALYGRPGVADALIGLQEAHAADVNLMLYCCWRAASGGGAATAAEIAALDASVAEWRAAAVRPLRALRRDMKRAIAGAPDDMRESLRAEVKRLELEAERIEQRLIVAAGGPPRTPESPVGPREDARCSLETYLAWLGAAVDGPVRESLEVILAAVVDPTSKIPESWSGMVTSRSRRE